MTIGHGWVRPLYGGIVAKCGGPGLCSECGEELRRLTIAVKELFYWQYSDHTPWFHYRLYTLIGAADFSNRARIGVGFPWELEAFEQWEAAPDQDEFFKKFGFNAAALRSSPTKT